MLYADHVNILIGGRLRQRRKALGLTQAQLAAKTGSSPTDLLSFEEGKERIPASVLVAASLALGVEVKWFFESISADPHTGSETVTPEIARFLSTDGATELVQHFLQIRTDIERRSVIEFAKSVKVSG